MADTISKGDTVRVESKLMKHLNKTIEADVLDVTNNIAALSNQMMIHVAMLKKV